MEEEEVVATTSSFFTTPVIIGIVVVVVLILISSSMYFYMNSSSPEALTKQFIETYTGKVVVVRSTFGSCLDNQGGAHGTAVKAAPFVPGSKNQQFLVKSSKDKTYFVFVNTNTLDTTNCLDFYTGGADSPVYFAWCSGDNYEYYPGRAATVIKTRVKNGVTEYMFKMLDKSKNNCLHHTGQNYTQKPCDEKDDNQYYSVSPA